MSTPRAPEPLLQVEDLRMAYGRTLIQRDVSFTVNRGSIFLVLGGSGCGKSTLLRHLVGLQKPAGGKVRYGRVNYWEATADDQAAVLRRVGMLFQSGALFSTLTVLDNVLMPLQLHSDQPQDAQEARARELLAAVGLADAADRLPSALSGGMKKRAGLARALALSPELVFLDEPSAGLDPISAARLDELILQLRDTQGVSFVIVSHELASLLHIGDAGIFLDADSKRPIAWGAPRWMREHSDHPQVQAFLHRNPEGG